jgi:hypothetical protein
MPFPENVKEDALVACGRCCTLCHKFCGIKIEVHHIREESCGGDNSYDNAIPVCFDCHADMRSYDHKHPKGNKYSEIELIRHRDNWYDKIKGNIGIVDKQIVVETDKKVYLVLVRVLPWNGSINFLKINDFTGTPFRLSKLDDLHQFEYLNNDPSFEFIDPDLETLRSKLLNFVNEFTLLIALNSFPTKNLEFNSIPKDWELENSEKFYQIVDKIHKTAESIVDTYHTLIRTATIKLGILPPTSD